MPHQNPQELFPPHSAKQWLEQIKKDLKGKPLESLQSHTQDKITIEPAYYNPREAPDTILGQRSPRAAASIAVHGDEEATNKLILQLLQNGAESLWLQLYAPVNLKKLLAEVDLNLITTTLYYQNELATQALPEHREYWEKNAPQNAPSFFVAFDPAVRFAQQGQFAVSADQDYQQVQRIISTSVGLTLPHAFFANCGASPAQQLGIALASLYELVVRLSANEHTPLQLNLAVGSDYFTEIAKCKAWLLLHAHLQEKLAENLPEVKLTATGLWSNKTTADAYNNLVRSSSEGMAALLGGAREIALQPYDVAFRQNGAFGLRMAVNQLLMLRHESHLDKNNDPAAGAYFIESLTEKLAEKGWEFFKVLEKQGGLIAALEAGWLQQEVQMAAHHTQKALQKGEKVLVGITDYQPEGEIPAPLPYPGDEPVQPDKALLPFRWADIADNEKAPSKK